MSFTRLYLIIQFIIMKHTVYRVLQNIGWNIFRDFDIFLTTSKHEVTKCYSFYYLPWRSQHLLLILQQYLITALVHGSQTLWHWTFSMTKNEEKSKYITRCPAEAIFPCSPSNVGKKIKTVFKILFQEFHLNMNKYISVCFWIPLLNCIHSIFFVTDNCEHFSNISVYLAWRILG